MSATLTLDQTQWRLNLQRYLAHFPGQRAKYLTQQFRLLLKDVIRLTPPKNYTQGRKRVAADIRKIARPFKTDIIRSKRLREIIAEGDIPAFNSFARSARKPWRGISAAQIPALHSRARDRRGRVRLSKPRDYFVLGRSEDREFNRYVRSQQSHVGIARSGWAPAYQAVGGKAPSWVARHGSRHGSATKRLNHPHSPSLIARNAAPWASRRKEGHRIVMAAFRSRDRAIARNLEHMLTTGLRAARITT